MQVANLFALRVRAFSFGVRTLMAASPTQQGANSIPAQGGAPVTPSDSADLAVKPCRALWVGGAGNLSLIFSDGSQATIVGVGTGVLVPLSVSRVLATGTTATNIVALY